MMKLSKEFIIALFQFRGNFILNKKNSSYEFKIQINMKKTKNNMLFLKDIKENYLNDIGRIVIGKSIQYIIQKHKDIDYFVKDYLLYNNPFINDKKEYFALWVQSFKYYKIHSFRGRRSNITFKVSNAITEKMADYYIKINELKIHQDTSKELSKYNKPKSYVPVDKYLIK